MFGSQCTRALLMGVWVLVLLSCSSVANAQPRTTPFYVDFQKRGGWEYLETDVSFNADLDVGSLLGLCWKRGDNAAVGWNSTVSLDDSRREIPSSVYDIQSSVRVEVPVPNTFTYASEMKVVNKTTGQTLMRVWLEYANGTRRYGAQALGDSNITYINGALSDAELRIIQDNNFLRAQARPFKSAPWTTIRTTARTFAPLDVELITRGGTSPSARTYFFDLSFNNLDTNFCFAAPEIELGLPVRLHLGDGVTSTTTGDPAISCLGGTGEDSSFYRFTAESETVRVVCLSVLELFGADENDCAIAVYSGANCNSLTELACNDDIDPVLDKSSCVTVSGLTIGETYWVQIAKPSGADGPIDDYIMIVTNPVVRVSSEFFPFGSGQTWDSRFDCLYDPLYLIELMDRRCALLDEIRLAEGEYVPFRGTYLVDDTVAIKGGYRGPSISEDPDDRDIDAFPTVLCGDLSNNDGGVAPDFTNRDENAEVILTVSVGITLDGVTVQNGGHPSTATSSFGGVASQTLPIGDEVLRVVDCRFTGNAGAISAAEGKAIELERCEFIGNGSRPQSVGSLNRFRGPVHATECRFEGNVVRGNGAGMNIVSLDHPVVIENCEFVNNRSGVIGVGIGGDLYVSGTDDAEIRDCYFTGSSARDRAESIFLWESNAVLDRCVFDGVGETQFFNNLDTGIVSVWGAASGVQLLNCEFVGCSTPVLFTNDHAQVSIDQCLIRENGGDLAYSLFLIGLDAQLTIDQSTIAANIMDGLNTPDPVEFRNEGTVPVQVRNSIVRNLEFDGVSTFLMTRPPVGAVSLRNSFAPNLAGYFTVNGSDADPGFVQFAAPYDFRLDAFSSAIDAGWDSFVPGVSLDFAGDPRFVDDANVLDTGIGMGAVVDIGAFERQVDSPACNPADLNIATAPSPAFSGFGLADGQITPTDFSAFSFFFSTGDLRADINSASAPSPAFMGFGVPDGLLTPTDFSAFAAYFGAGCPCSLPGCP